MGKKNIKGVCKKCGRKILPAWTTCNNCKEPGHVTLEGAERVSYHDKYINKDNLIP